MEEGGDAQAPLDKAEVDLGWMVNSPMEGFDGLYGAEAKQAVCSALEQRGRGHQTINWKIRPWLISRQRYWGTPIPVIHCKTCGAVPVPEEDLPVELPRDVVFGHGNPLTTSEAFLNVDCPTCGEPARRETDTMDTFIDSSWYFLRYTDALNDETPFAKQVANHWMHVDFYCGGIEHAQMHLIYARFMTKALRDLGLVDVDEPFNELLCQGMVNKAAPFCQPCGVTLSTAYEGQPCPHCGSELGSRSAKMSKSLGNTVSPEDMIARYGADTVRLFILFAANPTAGMDWSDAALDANHRVMVQMRGMPAQLMAWSGGASPMDGWLEARFTQRVHEFVKAMDEYDLRRAVELSHYEVIKDINWYTRRGGQNLDSPGAGHRCGRRWFRCQHLTWQRNGGRPSMAPPGWSPAAPWPSLRLFQTTKKRCWPGNSTCGTCSSKPVRCAWSPSAISDSLHQQLRLWSLHPGNEPWPVLRWTSSSKGVIQSNSFPCCRTCRLRRGSARAKSWVFGARKCCPRSSNGTMLRKRWSSRPSMKHRCWRAPRPSSPKNFNSRTSRSSSVRAMRTNPAAGSAMPLSPAVVYA